MASSSTPAASPLQFYKDQCTELKIKPNSALSALLPTDAAGAAEFKTVNLANNMVGTRGVIAVLKTVQHTCPHLVSLNLSGNNLTSPACKDILTTLVAHPTLTHLDVSNNDVRLGGPELVDLVKKNKQIIELNIEGTFLRPLFERLIAIHLKRNKSLDPSKKVVAFVEGTSDRKGSKPAFSESGDDDKPFGGGEDGSPASEGGFGNFGDFSEQAGNANHVHFEGGGGGGKRVTRRPTVSAEVINDNDVDNFVPQVNEKDEATRQWLKQLLERHDLFAHLEDFELLIAVDAMMDCERAQGSTLFEEGDDENDSFYIVGSGEVEVHKGDEVTTLTKGQTTQDLQLMYPQKCTETGVVTQDAMIYMLDRQTYRCVLAKASKKKRAMYEGFLSQVGFLKDMNKSELLQLADALKPANFEAGASLIKYGDVGETFYIIVEGTVEVYGRDDAGASVKVCEFTVGENVGELEFLHNHKCVADVKAKGFVRTAKMNRRHFEMVMGPVKDVLARVAATSDVYKYYRQQLEKMEKEEKGAAKH